MVLSIISIFVSYYKIFFLWNFPILSILVVCCNTCVLLLLFVFKFILMAYKYIIPFYGLVFALMNSIYSSLTIFFGISFGTKTDDTSISHFVYCNKYFYSLMDLFYPSVTIFFFVKFILPTNGSFHDNLFFTGNFLLTVGSCYLVCVFMAH